jgi:transcription initiation factor TFIID subunit TAF12
VKNNRNSLILNDFMATGDQRLNQQRSGKGDQRLNQQRSGKGDQRLNQQRSGKGDQRLNQQRSGKKPKNTNNAKLSTFICRIPIDSIYRTDRKYL